MARRPTHRGCIAAYLVLALLACSPGRLAQAQSAQTSAAAWPTKPLRLVVGFAPGSAADFVARAFNEPLSRLLGQSVVVENRPGAGSSIAAEFVAKAAPDGYTVLIASPSSISVNPLLNPRLGYVPDKDLLPISRITSSPLVVAVHPGAGIQSIRELIETARKSPGRLNYATSGNGSAPHLAAVLFASVAGISMTHVPFKGGSPAVQSVLAGDTQVTFATPPSVLPLVQAGRLKALATTNRNRSALFPSLPGMEEAGLSGYGIAFWYGLFAPSGTPPEAVRKWFEATQAVLQRAEVRQTLAREGTETSGSRSPEEFSSFLSEDARLWARLVRESGAKIE